MNGQFFTVNSLQTLGFAAKHLESLFEKHKWFQFKVNTEKGRSTLQNSALHVYCQLLADSLNESGQWLVIEKNEKRSEVPWSMNSVKEYMWRRVQKAVTQKDSSTRLSTKECMEVYETLNLHTAERLGVSIDWPSRGTM